MNVRNAVLLPVLLVALAGCSGRQPNAAFTIAPSGGGAPLTVEVEAVARAGEVVVFRWDFGDGAEAEGRTAAHTYTEPGQYTIELAVGDRSGASASQRRTIEVAGAEKTTPSTPTAREDPAVALAKATIAAHSCGSCHTLKNADFNLVGTVGPDLSRQAQRARSRDWLMQQLLDPTTIPDAQVAAGYAGMQMVMPSYGRLLSPQELEAVVAYLLHLGTP